MEDRNARLHQMMRKHQRERKSDAERRREEMLGADPFPQKYMFSLGMANPALKIPFSIVHAKQRELCERKALEKEGWEFVDL